MNDIPQLVARARAEGGVIAEVVIRVPLTIPTPDNGCNCCGSCILLVLLPGPEIFILLLLLLLFITSNAASNANPASPDKVVDVEPPPPALLVVVVAANRLLSKSCAATVGVIVSLSTVGIIRGTKCIV